MQSLFVSDLYQSKACPMPRRYCIRALEDVLVFDIQRCYRARLGIEVAAGCLPKPFLLLDADGLWMVGRDSMSLELEALSFRVMVESDLNVDGMLIEPAKER